jgi:hypothetical protein
LILEIERTCSRWVLPIVTTPVHCLWGRTGIMLRKMILAAASVLTAVIGAIIVPANPVAAWEYNQPYHRPCYYHHWHYDYYRYHQYYNYRYNHSGYRHYSYRHYPSYTYGPLVDCI